MTEGTVVESHQMDFRLEADFCNMKDEARCYYRVNKGCLLYTSYRIWNRPYGHDDDQQPGHPRCTVVPDNEVVR